MYADESELELDELQHDDPELVHPQSDNVEHLQHFINEELELQLEELDELSQLEELDELSQLELELE